MSIRIDLTIATHLFKKYGQMEFVVGIGLVKKSDYLYAWGWGVI